MTKKTTTLRLPPCGNTMSVQTALGGLQLEPKVCVLTKGHTGHHTDNVAVWLNTAELAQRLNLPEANR